MRKSVYVAAALMLSATVASATPATQPAVATAGHDYCTSGTGFAPCPKLAWDWGAASSAMLVVVPAQPSNQQAESDWCTADGALAKCPRLGQPTAAREWRNLMDVAGILVRVE